MSIEPGPNLRKKRSGTKINEENSDVFDSVEEAIQHIKEGKLVIVADDEDRENEGDVICAAEKITPKIINFMTKHCRGLICLALTDETICKLQLPQMVEHNTEGQKTAFTISI